MIIWYAMGFLILLVTILVAINIMLNGGILNEQEMINRLIDNPETLTAFTIENSLSKKEVFQLFQASPVPSMTELSGHFVASNLTQGVLSGVINFITDHLFGPGKWVGKGFSESDPVNAPMMGYNIFRKGDTTQNSRAFEVSEQISEIDGRPSIQFDYRNIQRGLIAGSMRDEIRKVNENLFLGMGMTTWGLGAKNPAHFILVRSEEDLTDENT